MAPPSPTGCGWGASNQDVDVDTIDLTLSSPEPEQRPRMPPQQQRPPNHFKMEGRADSGITTRVKIERRAPEMKPRGSHQRERRIHPHQLAQIVNTSNSGAVRSVLLDLCKISPALSGAVARGLTPHSTFAQGLIRQHRPTIRASTSRLVKTEDSDDQSAYERMKRRLAAERSVRGSSSNRVQAPSTFAGAHGPRLAASQSVPRIKREPQPYIGDTDSDLDQYIPGAFPHSAQQVNTNRLPLRATSGSSTANFTPNRAPLSERLARVQEGSKIQAETGSCTLCHKTIDDEFETCFYHPSPELSGNGVLTCGDCKEPLEELGCSIGMHVSQADFDRGCLNRSQPSGS